MSSEEGILGFNLSAAAGLYHGKSAVGRLNVPFTVEVLGIGTKNS